MSSLQDNNAKIPQDEESMPTSSRNMSIATKRYAGEKGYLDEDDKIIRKYDKDGDGVFTIDDAKSMAADFRRALLSQEMYRKMLIGCGGLLVVSWAGNFGLTYASKSTVRMWYVVMIYDHNMDVNSCSYCMFTYEHIMLILDYACTHLSFQLVQYL